LPVASVRDEAAPDACPSVCAPSRLEVAPSWLGRVAGARRGWGSVVTWRIPQRGQTPSEAFAGCRAPQLTHRFVPVAMGRLLWERRRLGSDYSAPVRTPRA